METNKEVADKRGVSKDNWNLSILLEWMVWKGVGGIDLKEDNDGYFYMELNEDAIKKL